MNLYLIKQAINNNYDSFDSAVVVADSEDAAKLIHPDGSCRSLRNSISYTWVDSPDMVTATLVGTCNPDAGFTEGDVVIASFNAG